MGKKNVLELNQKAVSKLKVPIASVGGELFIYLDGQGWVGGETRHDDWIMHEMGSVPANMREPRKIRFNVPFGTGSLATDARYLEWNYKGEMWGGKWQPLRLKPTEVIFENCIVDFETGEVTAHNQRKRPIWGPVVSCAYDPGVTHPEWEDTVARFFPAQEMHDYAQEVLSLVLTPHHFAKAIILLIGPSNTGKSTLASAIAAAPGGLTGLTSCNPDQCAARAFDCFPLVGKFVALCEEMEHLSSKGKTWLKAYSGGMFSWEVKFGQRGSSAPTAKFVGCSNSLPDFVEHSKAIHNRLVLLPMNEEIQGWRKEDYSTTSYWAHPERRKAVVAWLIHGLTRLARRNFQLEIPEMVEMLKIGVRHDTHPVLRWLKENTIYTGDYKEDRVSTRLLLKELKRDHLEIKPADLSALMLEAWPESRPGQHCIRDRVKARWNPGRGYEGVSMIDKV